MTAVVSVLLHDLVVGERCATICGRERNPTGIESAIRARFVRDSFHKLSTGLPTGLSRYRGPGGGPAMGNPRRCLENARGEKDGTSAAPDRSPDKALRAGWLGHPPGRPVTQAHRLRQR